MKTVGCTSPENERLKKKLKENIGGVFNICKYGKCKVESTSTCECYANRNEACGYERNVDVDM